jgi:hypothetical protein
MKPTKEQTATFAAAMKAFNKLYKPRTTQEIGIALGIPVDYNWDGKLKEEGDVESDY